MNLNLRTGTPPLSRIFLYEKVWSQNNETPGSLVSKSHFSSALSTYLLSLMEFFYPNVYTKLSMSLIVIDTSNPTIPSLHQESCWTLWWREASPRHLQDPAREMRERGQEKVRQTLFLCLWILTGQSTKKIHVAFYIPIWKQNKKQSWSWHLTRESWDSFLYFTVFLCFIWKKDAQQIWLVDCSSKFFNLLPRLKDGECLNCSPMCWTNDARSVNKFGFLTAGAKLLTSYLS